MANTVFPVLAELPPISSTVAEGMFQGASFPELTAIADNPDGNTSFAKNMFRNAKLPKLTTLPGDISGFGESSFQGAQLDSLTTFPTTAAPGSYPGMSYYAFDVSSFKGASLPSLTAIPDAVSQIGEQAFQNAALPALQTIRIQSYMIDDAFQGDDLPALAEIHTGTKAPNGEIYDSFSGANLPALKTIRSDLIDGAAFKDAQFGSPVTISGSNPAGSLVSIRNEAFTNATFQCTLTMPPQASDIRDSAFQGVNIKDGISNGIHADTIGTGAFANAQISKIEGGITANIIEPHAFSGAAVPPVPAPGGGTPGAPATPAKIGSIAGGITAGDIGESAFAGIELTATNGDIGQNAFDEVSLTGFSGDITATGSIATSAFANAKLSGSIGKISANTIGQSAFANAVLSTVGKISAEGTIENSAFANTTIGSVSGGITAGSLAPHAFSGPLSPSSPAAPAKIGSLAGGIAATNGDIGQNAFDGVSLTGFSGDITAAGSIATSAFANAKLPGSIGKISANTIGQSAFANAVLSTVGKISAEGTIENSAFANTTIGSVSGGITAGSLAPHAFSGPLSPSSPAAPAKIGSLAGGIAATNGDIGQNAFDGVSPTGFSGDITAAGSIATSAFANAKLPGSVGKISANAIGDSAFANATLGDVAGGIAAPTIGTSAFANATLGNVGGITAATSIGSSAFDHAALGNIGGDINAASIGTSAFAGATVGGITGKITSPMIGSSAFQGATLGNVGDISATNIGDSAFAGATLGNVGGISANAIGENAFAPLPASGDTPEKPVSIASLTGGIDADTIEGNAFHKVQISSLKGNIHAATIGAFAFAGATIGSPTDTTNAILATTIGNSAFQDAIIAGPVQLGNQSFGPEDAQAMIQSVGDHSFAGAKLPQISGILMVENIGNSAFDGTKLSENLKLSDEVKTIGSYAFANSTSFKASGVYDGKMLPANTSSNQLSRPSVEIGDHAFANSEVTQWILSPNDKLHSGAFADANQLADIYFPWGHLPQFMDGTTSSPITPEQMAAVFPTIADPKTEAHPNILLFHYPTDLQNTAIVSVLQAAVTAGGGTADTQVSPFSYTSAAAIPGRVTGLKEAENGGLPTYQVWDTLHFQVATGYLGNPNQPQAGDVRLSSPKSWELRRPDDVTTEAGAIWELEEGQAATGTVYPAQRPYGASTRCTFISITQAFTPGMKRMVTAGAISRITCRWVSAASSRRSNSCPRPRPPMPAIC